MGFDPPVVSPHKEGWGPSFGGVSSIGSTGPVGTLGSASFLKFPFEVALEPEKLGKACDFTYLSFQRGQKDGRVAVEAEKTDFRLVDSRPLKSQQQPRRFVPRRPFGQHRGGHMQQQQQGHGGRNAWQPQQQRGRGGGNFGQGAWGGRGGWQGGQRGWGYRQRAHAEWSIEPTPDWKTLHEIPLASLPKQKVDMCQAKFEDVGWCGELRGYQKEYDRILPKSPITLKDHRRNREFYQPGAMTDDTITSILQEMNEVKVAATDQVLACLMAASQSKHSWHIHVTKIDNKIILDKSDGSSLDMLSVGETARDPPNPEDSSRVNRPAELAIEAMRVNQDFQQQVLKQTGDPEEIYERAPFIPEGEVPAKKVYRYRLVTLPGKINAPSEFGKAPITLVTRAEIDGVLPGMTEKGRGFLTIRAFTEWDFHSGKPWRVQLENQKGGLFATESRNNACKLGRWVAQAIISGSDQLRLGFVSRVSPNNNHSHEVLFVQPHRTEDLASQIGLRSETAWGQVRYILDLVGVLPDGNYVLVKDPLKTCVRLYKPPEEEDADMDGLVGPADDSVFEELNKINSPAAPAVITATVCPSDTATAGAAAGAAE